MLKTGTEVDIVRADSVGRYRLELAFSDGHEEVVDFEPFLAASLNPETRRYLDPNMFRQYRIEWGNLVWGDYEMCFPMEDLYVGQLTRKEHLAVAEERATYGTDADSAEDSS